MSRIMTLFLALVVASCSYRGKHDVDAELRWPNQPKLVQQKDEQPQEDQRDPYPDPYVAAFVGV